MKINRSIILCVNLLLVSMLCACGGDGGSSSSGTTPDDNNDAPITGASLTLSSSLDSGELLAKQGEATIYAEVTGSDGLPSPDGVAVRFSASSGTITNSSSTVGGTATANYKSTNIGGNVTISASVDRFPEDALYDEYNLTVASGPAVQIITENIEPTSLGLRGSGTNEVGTFTFKVTDGTGGPVQDGQEVRFSLESPTGGAEFLSDPIATTVDGIVTISLISGNVSGVATVTATTESEVGTITTQARITIGNNEPDQRHLTFAADRLNIPGLIYAGIENEITAYVADRYSNPVPADTPVYFAGECGTVALTDAEGIATNTTNVYGQATATAITGNPTDQLCRYIFWTEGQEAYTDSNGNGRYDEGESHEDVSEPFIDANDNGIYDPDETYFDLDQNGTFTGVDDVWQGNTFVWTSANIRWSGEVAQPTVAPNTFSIAQGTSQDFTFSATDVLNGPLPGGTTINVTSECLTLTGEGTGEDGLVLPDAVNGPTEFNFSATAATDAELGPCTIDITVTGTEEDGNGTETTIINGEIKAGTGDTDGDSSNSIASFSGTGSDVTPKFTIEETGNYLFKMTHSGEDYSSSSFDLKDEFGNTEDYLDFASTVSPQAASDVKLDPGIYYISVDSNGSWTVTVTKF